MALIIAECGNAPQGSLQKAKLMIQVAQDCGADMVKFQAIKDFKGGSMDSGFYRQCEMSFKEYAELIEYGKTIDIPVFFSIFSWRLKGLESLQIYNKIAKSQSKKSVLYNGYDKKNTFVSVSEVNPPPLKNAKIMWASEYLIEDPDLEHIDKLSKFYGRPVGYSDHSIGVEASIEAIKGHNAPWVEKHFCLDRNIFWGSMQFRDALHSATPFQLQTLCKNK